MEYNLTSKYQHSSHCKDEKRRSYLNYYLNNVLILKLKRPFDENYEKGYDGCCSIKDVYILNNKLYQTRYSDSDNGTARNISYPLSKNILDEFNIPIDLKINKI